MDGEFLNVMEAQNEKWETIAPRKINDHGQVLINCWTRPQNSGPLGALQYPTLLWSEGRLTELGQWMGSDLNNHGQVLFLGWEEDCLRTQLWDAGSVTQIGPKGFEGTVMNDRGQIGGSYTADDFPSVPAYWSEGEMHLLTGLENESGFIEAMNNSGQFVVTREVENLSSHQHGNPKLDEVGIWNSRGFQKIISDDVLGVRQADINEQGSVVTAYYFPDGIPYAIGSSIAFWNGKNHWLSDMVGRSHGFSSDVAINDAGQIIAYDDENSFLLTPVEGPGN